MKDTVKTAIELLCHQLLLRLEALERVVVAFSGGVDSAVVAKAARLALGDDALAVTGSSESLPGGELELARKLAAEIGIEHKVIGTEELSEGRYIANVGDRCYWCKDELYRRLDLIKRGTRRKFILNGTNCDDLKDYRPGLEAAKKHGVISPLAECNIDKATVREIAKMWGLSVWNKPAGPCLASRLAPGISVTDERLRRVDAAESELRSWGFEPVRVRLHESELVRIEVPSHQIHTLIDGDVRSRIVQRLRQLGFRYITFDLEGFRSGSLNQLVTLNPN